MYVVGVTKTCKRLAFAPTQRLAEEYVSSLPDAEHGIYYIDGPCHDVIVVEGITVNDLPNR